MAKHMTSNMESTEQDTQPRDRELQDVDRIIEKVGNTPDSVVPILQRIQERFQWIPRWAIHRVCDTADITPSQVMSVATFYSQFRLKPAGRHTVKICFGTACHIKGAERIYSAFQAHLGISKEEDTDKEGLFTLEKVACLGCCMLAPVIQIDDVTYGFLDNRRVPLVLKDFLEGRSDKRRIPRAGWQAAVQGEIRMCLCSSCRAAGAEMVFNEFQRQIAEAAIPSVMKMTGCTGISYEVPFVEVDMVEGGVSRYGRVRPSEVRSIIRDNFRPSGLLNRFSFSATHFLERILTDESWRPVAPLSRERFESSLFWWRQKHIVTEHCGSLDPLDFDAYRSRGGFDALAMSLNELSSEGIIEAIDKSGLRGRGGAGFPTARKWAGVARASGDEKFVICNGDEGDPGAFMDRSIIESFPFRVLEGVAIASVAVSAKQAFVYVRGEYPLAMKRLGEALEICRSKGLIGESMMDTDRVLDLRVVQGAGAFVCGEETALIAALEGRRGTPRFRPPYPDSKGLWGKPTLINNVETLALVPWIIRNGAEEFSRTGVGESRGTKTFALAGKVARGGLIEVPMGMTLREIVEEIGGGAQDGKALKAVQVGGPSGGCVPESLLNTSVDFEALQSVGAMMGSGGLVVLDETDCMVDIARYFMTFTQAESCGKCTFCRIGTEEMLEILQRLCKGAGTEEDLERLERIAVSMQWGSLCGLGQTAPNPVLSTLRFFRDEYIAHIQGRCPAKVCKSLITYTITESCIGCTRCAQRCPSGAIEAKPYKRHSIDPGLCVRCDTCRQVCPSDAVSVE